MALQLDSTGSFVGDLDADGYAAPLGTYQPRLVLTYGSSERFSGAVELSSTPDQYYPAEEPRLALGDLNGDRRPDLVLGASRTPRGEIDGGALFFIPGSTGQRLDVFDFNLRDAVLLGRANGFFSLGRGVSASGDVNADGFQDVLVMRDQGWDDAGGALLIFGGSDL